MKILIDYETNPKLGNFEGVRLRKSIKGSLELNNIPWVESILFEPDIAHFLSPEDESELKEAKANGAFCIVNALYSENDPTARFLTQTANGLKLKPRALKMLELADLVLVPTIQGKKLLKELGYEKNNVKTWKPPINLTRFENNDPIESQTAYQYLKIQNNQKYSISIGNFDDEEAIKQIKEIAAAVPELRFYFIGCVERPFERKRVIRKVQRKSPPNLSFISILPDDIYRSAVINAFDVLLFGDACLNDTVALEAFASRDRVVVLGDGDELIVNGKNAFCSKDTQEVSDYLRKELGKKITDTIIEGYKTAKANTLRMAGFELTKIYKDILKGRDKK